MLFAPLQPIIVMILYILCLLPSSMLDVRYARKAASWFAGAITTRSLSLHNCHIFSMAFEVGCVRYKPKSKNIIWCWIIWRVWLHPRGACEKFKKSNGFLSIQRPRRIMYIVNTRESSYEYLIDNNVLWWIWVFYSFRIVYYCFFATIDHTSTIQMQDSIHIIGGAIDTTFKIQTHEYTRGGASPLKSLQLYAFLILETAASKVEWIYVWGPIP